MDYDNFLELVKNTRSIRRFKPDPVPDDYIDKIIEAACWAPSGFNSQPWEFVVIREPELKEKLIKIVTEFRVAYYARLEETREPWMRSIKMPIAAKNMDWTTAPVYIMLCGDKRTQIGLPMMVRADQPLYQSIYTSSLANAFLYMHMAATTLGLASMWVTLISSTPLHVLAKDVLGIPRDFDIYDMMAFGYPALKPRPKLLKSREKAIHYDYCDGEGFRTDEEVNDYVRRARNWTVATTSRAPD